MSTKSAIAAIALSVAALSAGAETITFDEAPGGALGEGEALTTQYSALGVIFAGFEDGVERAPVVGTDTTLRNPTGKALSNSNPFLGERLDVLRITFAAPVSELSWTIRGAARMPTFNFYDASDTLLGSLTPTPNPRCCRLQPTSTELTGITRIDALQPSENWFWVMDDLTFTIDLDEPTIIPVPASLPLFLAGLGSFGLFARRANGHPPAS